MNPNLNLRNRDRLIQGWTLDVRLERDSATRPYPARLFREVDRRSPDELEDFRRRRKPQLDGRNTVEDGADEVEGEAERRGVVEGRKAGRKEASDGVDAADRRNLIPVVVAQKEHAAKTGTVRRGVRFFPRARVARTSTRHPYRRAE